MSALNSVELNQKPDGSWQATHVPSGKVSHGLTQEEAESSMKEMLGLNKIGKFTEPLTSDQFEGVTKEIAEFLEGDVSEMLALHSGFARLDAYEQSVAYIRLGGGCSGCPSSAMTLVSGVKQQLQEKFGEEVILDVAPVQ